MNHHKHLTQLVYHILYYFILLTPVLKELRWLPVCQRFHFTLVYTHPTVHNQYHHSNKELVIVYRPTKVLRFNSALTLQVPLVLVTEALAILPNYV